MDIEMKKDTIKYYESLKSKGIPLIDFKCVHCQSALQTEKNLTSREWDTLSFCIECNKPFFKITLPHGGAVISIVPPAH